MKEQFQVIKATDQEVQKGYFGTIKASLARFGFLGSLARYLLLKNEIKKFIARAESPAELIFRQKLLKRFGIIQNKIQCAHSPFQFVLMAEYIFNLKEDGPLVQCGCFKGGSTAKLSLLAEKMGRVLYVCDSFQGLPDVDNKKELLLEGHGDMPVAAFAAGEYSGSLEEVRDNIRRYGNLDQCVFVPGFFNASLKDLDVKPAFVFIDVDLISSARDCLRYLWPRSTANCYWFTHEAGYPDYIAGIMSRDWWREVMRQEPPIIWGAGSGLSSLVETLAYFKKCGSTEDNRPAANEQKRL
jgi:O-methyltransferase